jgi:hypothetical protein
MRILCPPPPPAPPFPQLSHLHAHHHSSRGTIKLPRPLQPLLLLWLLLARWGCCRPVPLLAFVVGVLAIGCRLLLMLRLLL